jgi:hypothetical protein
LWLVVVVVAMQVAAVLADCAAQLQQQAVVVL